MIRYTNSLEAITANNLYGFFVGWPNPPSPQKHLDALRGSYAVWLALDDNTGNVIGFINAVSDGVLSAFIPLLEVLPEYQKRGVGAELVRRMLDDLSHLYGIDLICDADIQPFYEKLGLHRYTGMIIRNYDRLP